MRPLQRNLKSKVVKHGVDLLGKSIVYTSALYASNFTKLISGVVLAKLLGPSLFGLRNAFQLTVEYESFSDLGTFSALNRQAPFYRGAHNVSKAEAAVATIFAVNIFYALAAGAILMGVSQYLRLRGYDSVYVDFIMFLGIKIITSKVILFLQVKLKIDKNFSFLSKVEIAYGLIGSTVSIVLVYLFGFKGFLIAVVISDLTYISLVLTKERGFPCIIVEFPLLRELIKVGIPLMILFLALTLFRNADRTLIFFFISEEALGLYGVATVAANIIAMIPHAIHNVTLAPIMEILGRTGDKHNIKYFFDEPMVLMAYTIPFIIAGMYFFIHLPIEYYMQKYSPSLIVIKILVFGVYLDAIASPALSVSIAMDRLKALIVIVVPLVALNFSINFFLIKVGLGIEGAALGTTFSCFVSFCVLLYYAEMQFGQTITDYFRMLFLLVTPIAYSIMLLIVIDELVNLRGSGILADISIAILKWSIFVILYCMVFIRIRNHSAFAKLINCSFITHFIPHVIRMKLTKN